MPASFEGRFAATSGWRWTDKLAHSRDAAASEFWQRTARSVRLQKK